MRILVVHNRYSSRVPSGENLSVHDEVTWLRKAGVDVAVHEASNDDVMDGGLARKAQQAVWAPWSLPAARGMTEVLDETDPDIVHVHNLFPLLTGSVPWAAVRRGIPVVWTVRNQRADCIAGTHFRDGQPCHECRPGRRLAGIRHACYRDSIAASALLTGATGLFRAMAKRKVTAVAISEALRDWLVDTNGFPADRVHVKYNGIPAPPLDRPLTPAAESRTYLFAAKLAPYKGIDLLLDAWARADLRGATLRIVGDGPEADAVRAAAEADPRIDFVGPAPSRDMTRHFGEARAVVVPSTWDEPFGRVAAEALAHGRPVITSGLGGLHEVVGDDAGWITGTDPERLARALVEADDDAAIRHRSRAATERHRERFGPDVTTQALVDIYERCLRPRPGR
ncbi:MAG TPA: glycosyltransferase family 4 protein [Acidimicrobiales bacterium]